MQTSDPRHRLAVATNRRWYELTHRARGSRWRVDDGVWSCADPPPWHSGVVALEPSVAVGRVAAVAAEVEAHAVADDFADLDLAAHGRRLLFEASWIHRGPPSMTAAPPGWVRIGTTGDLERWSAAHDYVGVLAPSVLDDPDLVVLGRVDAGGDLTAGVVLHGSADAVGVSNVWSHHDDVGWDEVVALAARHQPDRPLVGYEHGADIDRALAAGFDAVGTHRVWVR